MGHWVQVTLRTFSLRIESATSEVKGERSDHCATEAPMQGHIGLNHINEVKKLLNYSDAEHHGASSEPVQIPEVSCLVSGCYVRDCA